MKQKHTDAMQRALVILNDNADTARIPSSTLRALWKRDYVIRTGAHGRYQLTPAGRVAMNSRRYCQWWGEGRGQCVLREGHEGGHCYATNMVRSTR